MTEEARRELDGLLAEPGHRQRPRWNARKSGCSSCAPWPANMRTTPDGLAGGAGGFPGAAGGAGRRRRLAEGRRSRGRRAHARPIWRRRRNLSKARAAAAKKLEDGGGRRTGAAQAGPCQIPRRAGPPDEEGSANGLERVAFEVATVEGAAFGSPGQNRLGRRAGAFLAGPESGAGPDRAARRPGVRRSGSRRRRRGGRCGGRAAAAPGRNHPGAAGHPFAPGGGPRRAAFPHFPGRRQDPHRLAGRRCAAGRNRPHAVGRQCHRRSPRRRQAAGGGSRAPPKKTRKRA